MLQKTQTNASLTYFNKTEPALMTRVKGLQFWFKLVTTDYFLSHYDLSNLQPNSRYHLRSAPARFPSSRLRDASTGDRPRSAQPGPGPCGLVSCHPRGTGVRGPRASRKLSSASVTSRLAFSVHYVNFVRFVNDEAVRSCSSECLISRFILERGKLARQEPTLHSEKEEQTI